MQKSTLLYPSATASAPSANTSNAGTPAAGRVQSWMPREVAAPETRGLINRWLRECDGSHGLCSWYLNGSRRLELPPLPTRVVDLGDLDRLMTPAAVGCDERGVC